jgi:hypothetical protein
MLSEDADIVVPAPQDTKPVAKTASKAANFEKAPKSTAAPVARDGKSDRGRGPKPSTRGSRTQDKHSRSDRDFTSEKKEVAGVASLGEPVQAEIDGEADAVEAVEEYGEEYVEEYVEPEIEYKSFEQYMSEKGAVKKAPTKLRAANEGADSSKWKEASVLVMKEDDFIVMSKVLVSFS